MLELAVSMAMTVVLVDLSTVVLVMLLALSLESVPLFHGKCLTGF